MRFLIGLFFALNCFAQSIDLSPNAFQPTNGYGTVNFCLKTDGVGTYSWQSCGGGGGTPGGSSGQFQYNNGGSFGGTTGVTFTGANTITFGGASSVFDNGSGRLELSSGTAVDVLGPGITSNLFEGPSVHSGAATLSLSSSSGNVDILPSGTNAVRILSGKKLMFNGSTSGEVDIAPPATVTSYSLIWPSAQGAASTVLQNNGSGVLSWAASSGGTPGGPNTAIQFNNSGAFGGTAQGTGSNGLNFTYDGAATVKLYSAAGQGIGFPILEVGDPNSGATNVRLMGRQSLNAAAGFSPGLVWTHGTNNDPGIVATADNASATSDIQIFTGAASGGNSGSILLTPGTASGTVGKIKLNDRSGTITSGQVWTATASDGSGHYATFGPFAAQDLSNLTTTAINQDLLPASGGANAIGSNSLYWTEMRADAFKQHAGHTMTISTGDAVNFNDADVSNLNTLAIQKNGQSIIQHMSTSGVTYDIFWPSVQGAANTFLKNDGSGNLSWAVGTSSSPIAFTYENTNDNNSTGLPSSSWTTIKYQSMKVDTDSLCNTSTGICTIGTTGLYELCASAETTSSVILTSDVLAIRIVLNGTTNISYTERPGVNVTGTANAGDSENYAVVLPCTVRSLTASDTVQVLMYSTTASTTMHFLTGDGANVFTLHKIN